MSAFGYFGSKLRLATQFCRELPPHNAWVELFCGSAAMTIAKQPARIEIINDVNGSIINFYRQLRNNGTRLRKLIQLTPYARQELQLAREPDEGLSDLEKARRFFITAMMAINGSFGDTPGGFSYSDSYTRNGMEARVSRWAQMHKYLEEVTARLKSVRIEHLDAIKLFKKYSDRPATLVYFDPPYLAERVNGYDHEANTTEFHEKILNAIVEAKCMVFISGYENKLYNSYLTKRLGWSKKIVKATTKGNNGKSFERREVVWFNPAYQKALAAKRMPVSLSQKERDNQKLNPRRISRSRQRQLKR